MAHMETQLEGIWMHVDPPPSLPLFDPSNVPPPSHPFYRRPPYWWCPKCGEKELIVSVLLVFSFLIVCFRLSFFSMFQTLVMTLIYESFSSMPCYLLFIFGIPWLIMLVNVMLFVFHIWNTMTYYACHESHKTNDQTCINIKCF